MSSSFAAVKWEQIIIPALQDHCKILNELMCAVFKAPKQGPAQSEMMKHTQTFSPSSLPFPSLPFQLPSLPISLPPLSPSLPWGFPQSVPTTPSLPSTPTPDCYPALLPETTSFRNTPVSTLSTYTAICSNNSPCSHAPHCHLPRGKVPELAGCYRFGENRVFTHIHTLFQSYHTL